MSLNDLKPAHTDIAVYENAENENLIMQYYETGGTGNPRSRLIKTRNMNSSIRKFEKVHDAALLDSLQLGTYRDFEEGIPDVYLVGKDTFNLRKIHNPWMRDRGSQNL